MTTERKRDVSWDILKGIAIFSVILGHCIQFDGIEYFESGACWDNKILQFLYSYHMPLFMMISGYFSAGSIQKYVFTDYLKTRVQRLLFPVFTFTIITLILEVPYNYGSVFSFLKHSFITLITSLWFLWALFAFQLFLYAFRKLKSVNYIYLYIVSFLIMLFIPDIPATIAYGKSTMPAFLFGAMCYEYKLFDRLKANVTSVVLLIFTFACLFVFYNKDCYVYTSLCDIYRSNPLWQLLINIYRCVIGISGSLSLIMLVRYLLRFGLNLRLFAYLGRQSLGLYVFSSIILLIEGKYFQYTLVEGGFNVVLNVLLTFILSLSLISLVRKQSSVRLLFIGEV